MQEKVDVSKIKSYFRELQSKICYKLSEIDGKCFYTDNWEYQENRGGGRTCVLENSSVIERGGVNFSNIHNKYLPDAILRTKPELQE